MKLRHWIITGFVGLAVAVGAVFTLRSDAPFALKHPLSTFRFVTTSQNPLKTLLRCLTDDAPPIPGLVRPAGEPRVVVGSNAYEVDLVRTDKGLLIVTSILNGKPADLIVDTGATKSMIDQRFALEQRLPTTGESSYIQNVSGAGSRSPTVIIEQFALGEVIGTGVEMMAYDLSSENQTLKAHGTRPVAGILGIDVLRKLGATIDIERSKLILKPYANAPK